MNKSVLRILAIVLVFTMVFEILPINQIAYAAELEEEALYLPVSVMQRTKEGYIEGEYQIVETKIVDGCILVDAEWLSTQLGLSMIITPLVTGGTAMYLGKSDSSLMFQFVPGRDTAYAISKYLGTITAKLGTNVLEQDEKIWVPLVMTLNLFDAQIQNRGEIAYLYPCINTVVDILHPFDTYLNETTAYSYLRQYEYDVVDDSHMGENMSKIQLSYILFYRKLKNLFQGTVNFDFEKLKEAMPSNTDDIAETLAMQLFLNTEDELKNINESVMLSMDTFNGISTGLGNSVGMIEDAAGVEFAQSLENWIKMGDEIAESTEGFISQKQVYSFMETVRGDLQAEELIKNDISNYSKGFNVASNAGAILFNAWLKNITLTSEINSANAFNVSAMKKYIESYNALPAHCMKEDMVALWDGKADLYGEKNSSVLGNKELRNQVFDDVANSVTSVVAESGVEQILSIDALTTKLPALSGVSGLLFAYKLVSIGWDFAEYIVNKATGEKFDAMDAFSYAIYAAYMEKDSYACLNEFLSEYYDTKVMDEAALEEYRQLQWAQLKSYYIVRQNILTFYEPMKQEQDMSLVTQDEIADSNYLLDKMAVLSAGTLGVTQEGLNRCYEKLENINVNLIELLYDGSYIWYVEPSIVADDIFYLADYPDYGVALNEVSKQADNSNAVILQDNQYGIIDMNGDLLTDVEYKEIANFGDNYMMIKSIPEYSEKYGKKWDIYWLNNNGDISAGVGNGDLSLSVYYYYNGNRQRAGNSSSKFVNEVIPVQETEEYAGFYSVSKTFLENLNGKYAIDNNTSLVTDFIFDECGSVADGLLAVSQNGKWGYVNEQGEIVIPIEYDASWEKYPVFDFGSSRSTDNIKNYCYAASDGYVVLRKNDDWELRDIDGQVIIKSGIFEAIRPVFDGKCWAKKDGKWGVIKLHKPEDQITNDLLSGIWLQKDSMDAMQFNFMEPIGKVLYYYTTSHENEYTTSFDLQNSELKIDFVNLDTGGNTTLYYDLSYKAKDFINELHIVSSVKNEGIDTKGLFGYEKGIPGTYVQINREIIKQSLGVPDNIEIEIFQGQPFFWSAGEIYTTHFIIEADKECIAMATVNALTGEHVKEILMYNNY